MSSNSAKASGSGSLSSHRWHARNSESSRSWMRQNVGQADSEAREFEMSRREEDLHSDLARANLLRLRGEFDQAEQLCLNVLERFPDNAAAHTLLGDIAFSQDK